MAQPPPAHGASSALADWQSAGGNSLGRTGHDSLVLHDAASAEARGRTERTMALSAFMGSSTLLRAIPCPSDS